MKAMAMVMKVIAKMGCTSKLWPSLWLWQVSLESREPCPRVGHVLLILERHSRGLANNDKDSMHTTKTNNMAIKNVHGCKKDAPRHSKQAEHKNGHGHTSNGNDQAQARLWKWTALVMTLMARRACKSQLAIRMAMVMPGRNAQGPKQSDH